MYTAESSSAWCFIFSLACPVRFAAADQQIERSSLFVAKQRRVQFIFFSHSVFLLIPFAFGTFNYGGALRCPLRAGIVLSLFKVIRPCVNLGDPPGVRWHRVRRDVGKE